MKNWEVYMICLLWHSLPYNCYHSWSHQWCKSSSKKKSRGGGGYPILIERAEDIKKYGNCYLYFETQFSSVQFSQSWLLINKPLLLPELHLFLLSQFSFEWIQIQKFGLHNFHIKVASPPWPGKSIWCANPHSLDII